MSSQLNKNLINLSKGHDSLGLKEQLSNLQNELKEQDKEHTKAIGLLTNKYTEHMKITPEE